MKFTELLQKLGILRYGTKTATYTSAKDRPAEFLMDDVANAEKDLTTREDVARAAAALKAPGGRKVFFWVVVGLAALGVLLLAAGGGLTPWLAGGLGLWAGILYLTYRFAYDGRFTYLGMGSLLAFGLIVSLLLLGIAASPRP